MKKPKLNIYKPLFLGMGLIIITLGVFVVSGKGNAYQFSQLDAYFEKDLFGIVFDYNSFITTGKLVFRRELLRWSASMKEFVSTSSNTTSWLA